MIENTTIDLIQKVLDGEATTEEVAHLDQLISVDEEVHHMHMSMKSMVNHLDNFDQVEPRPFLATRIKAAVRSHSKEAEGFTISQKVTNFFGSLANPRFGFTFVTGIAAGLLLFATTSSFLDSQDKIDPSLMTGTILLDNPEKAQETIKFNEGQVTFESTVIENSIIIDISGNSISDITIAFEYLPDQFSFSGISGFEGTEGTISHSSGHVEFTKIGDFEVIISLSQFSSRSGVIGYNVKCNNEIQTGTLGFDSTH